MSVRRVSALRLPNRSGSREILTLRTFSFVCIVVFIFNSGANGLHADRIELKDGTTLNDSLFLGINRQGFARIQRADGRVITVPMSDVRSMIRSSAPPATASKRPRPRTPPPRFLEPLRSDPLQPAASHDAPRTRPFGSTWNNIARWLTPGLPRYQSGDVYGGLALFAGFVASLAATVLYYQSWQNIAAESSSDFAYNLNDTGRLDAKFSAARRNTYIAGAALALISGLHVHDAIVFTPHKTRSGADSVRNFHGTRGGPAIARSASTGRVGFQIRFFSLRF